MNSIQVVAGIIIRNHTILAAQRANGAFRGGWEFPGGKLESIDATPQAALHRELREELSVEVEVHELLCQVEHDYEDFHLSMRCFICTLTAGSSEPRCTEHAELRWLEAGQLCSVSWLPADLPVVKCVHDYLSAMRHKQPSLIWNQTLLTKD